MSTTVELIRSTNNNDKIYQTMVIGFPILSETLRHCTKIIGTECITHIYRGVFHIYREHLYLPTNYNNYRDYTFCF